MKRRMLDLGIVASPGSPEDIARQVAAEREKWRRIIEASGARAE